MAIDLYIPRIEWKELSFTGTLASGDPTVTGIASTEDIEEGMVVTGTGIPVGAVVESKTADSVTLSADVTDSGAQTLTAFFRFDFRYPPSKDTEWPPRVQAKTTASLSGKRQVQTDFIDSMRELEFWFLTQAERDTLIENFFLDWATFGKPFRYFQDKEDAAFDDCEMESPRAAFARQVKKHPEFLYLLKLQFRKLIF